MTGINAAHGTGRNKHELLADRVPGRLDLSESVRNVFSRRKVCTYHFPHTDFSIDAIHEDIAALRQLSTSQENENRTYNSSRHRTGAPIASHSDKRRQMVEKDFSPPDRVFASLPLPTFVGSGST